MNNTILLRHGCFPELKSKQAAIVHRPGRQTIERMRELRETNRSFERALNTIVVICGNSIASTQSGRRRPDYKPLGYLR
ncbi:hypothetical protein EN866_24155 [Mesorhizobium sp. M2D.F.Ca.ET.223.01.1.1]|uniref:hypothetical protein n=1 Tax=Mesorhizobium sp. M2D.F.Ca.ET.223.01.1.1 TaxID=2563940 RepID=UPI0010930281|nr:hypothetical protein [Mesorhizobium sp. M2D.F.Ca.ET.223.01.1.1]TGP86394.1 hypothetical protein EN864_24165 [bacterium M00.F.Ca.ET.221.01.1.1]TGR88736.1 hypothetical protein EN866_24155 [Mesorhizobium sp. M2D.F.Ca.ET.223.01.1.1]